MLLVHPRRSAWCFYQHTDPGCHSGARPMSSTVDGEMDTSPRRGESAPALSSLLSIFCSLVTCCPPVLGKEQGSSRRVSQAWRYLRSSTWECQAGWNLSFQPRKVSGWLLVGPVTQLHLPPSLHLLVPSSFMENVNSSHSQG